jgi:hypothetical protein
MAAPVETKVTASTAAAAVSGLALWTLGHYVFKSGVPDVVASWVYVLVPAVVTFGAGYLAKHTPRPPTPLAITVPTAAENAEIARQVSAAVRAYPQKTLIAPAVTGTDPPAAAGPPA